MAITFACVALATLRWTLHIVHCPVAAALGNDRCLVYIRPDQPWFMNEGSADSEPYCSFPPDPTDGIYLGPTDPAGIFAVEFLPSYRVALDLPLWPLPLPALFLFLAMRRRRSADHSVCRHCSYDLTGNVSGICPECGRRIPNIK